MMVGDFFLKYRHLGKPHERFFRLHENLKSLVWSGGEKLNKDKSFTLSSALEIREGVSLFDDESEPSKIIIRGVTINSRRVNAAANAAAKTLTNTVGSTFRPLDSDHCFSLFDGDGDKMLNLVCPNEKVYSLWLFGFNALLEEHKLNGKGKGGASSKSAPLSASGGQEKQPRQKAHRASNSVKGSQQRDDDAAAAAAVAGDHYGTLSSGASFSESDAASSVTDAEDDPKESRGEEGSDAEEGEDTDTEGKQATDATREKEGAFQYQRKKRSSFNTFSNFSSVFMNGVARATKASGAGQKDASSADSAERRASKGAVVSSGIP